MALLLYFTDLFQIFTTSYFLCVFTLKLYLYVKYKWDSQTLKFVVGVLWFGKVFIQSPREQRCWEFCDYTTTMHLPYSDKVLLQKRSYAWRPMRAALQNMFVVFFLKKKTKPRFKNKNNSLSF